ncbi:GNAT family N-acetyltransferase [Rummeliibacillus sp. TYF-LIM-RU47]|uniref:GNAT family N-acetyltransferase n=1 Tax=Rummeliibacillus sp. TYF-LIM-RU47 TaxID=2608406 RepID=UPI00123A201B|nr:GNAT family N-acetyltransferase [Rummeliibacillus sp. TYF-LIM-RU47]
MGNINTLIVEHSQMEGERILLRPVSFDDAEDMFEYTSDEETTRFLYAEHKDLNQTKNFIANYFIKEPIGKYAIVIKESSKMIGAIEFRVHEHNHSGELGYTMNRQYWGNGYATEAGELILDLAFNILGLERVFAAYEVKNVASGRVLERLGMKCEGILRKSEMIKGVLVDSAYHSILKEEYILSRKKED